MNYLPLCLFILLTIAYISNYCYDIKMPELPEVETVCRGLAPAMEGAILKDVIIREYKLRFPIPVNFRSRAVGRQITNVTRGQNIFLFILMMPI